MPDLGLGGNLSLSSSLTLTRCPALKPNSPLPPPPTPPDAIDQSDSITSTTATITSVTVKTLVKWDQSVPEGAADLCNGSSIRVLKRTSGGRLGCKKGFNNNISSNNGKCLDDYVRVWVQKKMDAGVSQSRCLLPFLVGAKKMVECLFCCRSIYHGEGMQCSVRNCQGVYHLTCVMEGLGVSNLRKFKCPQHECFTCKGKFHWRCVRCTVASHNQCAPWSDEVVYLKNQPGRAVCWRHPTNWRLDKKHVVPATDIEEIFCRLPLPYIDEEFKIDLTWKDLTENKLEPPPYVHIRRNVYLVKKKRDDSDGDVGCTNCSSTCCENCVCRVQCISCSKACRCPETCTNRPFRKEKKIKIVKTEFCGWGVEAAEPLNKGDFIIEYIGEVIDDKLCEQRLWDMKYKGVQNFYMCEIRKDFTIDATFKGNSSRFLNHSCKPNCILEKWDVEGETRVGVFAAGSIRVGEPLTYDYRFVRFGPEVKCYCGAPNCQGYLGTKRKIAKLNIGWGAKRKRTSTACVAIITM
ncbi:histone-lysine N-methyltransferase ASHR3 isoform X1 [Populus nigra]|uniref:histone-lysine N-methyltransferase ASHR3 isoform X1 n=1 Tax=Populus nigra TaxID=3691 RepID=UPI002B26E170|nr:histone-lysine N-methyltransferase ASHR3 isoform X1 [Populus nigra]